MALLPLLLLPLAALPAAVYLCCVRRHTGIAAAVVQRREPGRPAARSPPRDTVSSGGVGRAGAGGRRGAGPGAHLSPPLRSGPPGCAASGCASSAMRSTR